MFMRIVEASVKEDGEQWMEHLYKDQILPALEKTDGCIFAGLLYSIDQTNRYISLTLWRAKEDAHNYVQSGEYQKNFDLLYPMMEESNEWKIQLSKDNTVMYTPVHEAPLVKTYSVAGSKDPLPGQLQTGPSYLRILSLKINKADTEEFIRIYNMEILPELTSVDGCKYAFLIDNSASGGEMLSFSMWDNKESVEQYEMNGTFQSLLDKVSHTLGDLYQWKMSLENKSDAGISVTSQDINISKFTLVTGKKFK